MDTNVNFLIDLASHPSFQSGDVHTGFIDQHFDSLFPPLKVSDEYIAQAIAALVTNELNAVKVNASIRGQKNTSFSESDSFRVNATAIRTIELKLYEDVHKIQLKQRGTSYQIKIGDAEWRTFEVYPVQEQQANRASLKLNLDGVQSTFSAVISSELIDVFNEVNEEILIFSRSPQNSLFGLFFTFYIYKTHRLLEFFALLLFTEWFNPIYCRPTRVPNKKCIG